MKRRAFDIRDDAVPRGGGAGGVRAAPGRRARGCRRRRSWTARLGASRTERHRERSAARVRQMLVDRESRDDAVPESTRRTLRYDARDVRDAAHVPADGYAPIPRTRAPESESAPAESTQPAVRLDGDWIQTMDASSGDLYYCNLKTGESSWDPPPRVPPPTPQETASLLRAATMPRSVSVPRVGLNAHTEPPAVPPRDPKMPKEHLRFASSVPRDALPSATRPWERFSKRISASSSAAKSAAVLSPERYGSSRYSVAAETKPKRASVSSVLADKSGRMKSARAWRAARCKATGRRYFYESATRRTVWTLPESSDEDAPPPPPLESDVSWDGIDTKKGRTSSADAHLVLRPTATPPASPGFVRSRNAPGSSSAGNARGARGAVSPEKPKPEWNSKTPADAEREEVARARGAALRAARAEAPRVSSPTATTLSPRRASPGAKAAPSPATLAKMEVLRRRSSSARERRLAYGEQVRARTFADMDIVVSIESGAKAMTTLSRTTSLASPSPSPSPSPRVSASKPTPARRASSRRSMSVLQSLDSRRGEKEKAEERHNPFAAVSAEEAAAVTLQSRVRGFLARKRAREIKAWAATKSGVEKLRADERARAELEAASTAKLKAERSRRSLPPGLIGSFNDRAARTALDKKKSASEKPDAASLAERNTLPPEPPADAAASDFDEAASELASAAVQDARLPFEAYAATHFATSAAADRAARTPKKSFGCFGFCFSSDRRGSSATEHPRKSASHSSSPIRGALTAAAEALGASGVSAALFRAMLDHAGDDKRVSLTRARVEAAKQTAPSSLFFTRRGGTVPHSTEVIQALDAFARGDDAGAAMRDEWYCQFLKQTSNHPSAERELRLWRLAYLAACAFAPSEALALYVLKRCRDAAAGTAANGKASESKSAADHEERLSISVVAELTRARLVAALKQGASFSLLSDETRTRAADRDFVVDNIPLVPAFGATLEELFTLETRSERLLKARAANRSPTFARGEERINSGDPSKFAFSFSGTTGDDTPSLTSFVPRVLLALFQNLERNGKQTRGLFRGAPEAAAAAAAAARSATRAEDVEAAARDVSPAVAAELVKLVLTGMALPVIPFEMHAACLASEASPQGVTRALVPLPPAHRAALAATLRAAAAAAAADAFGAPASGEAARAAEAIAAELAPCLMFPAAGTGEAHDEQGRAVFVTRMIRMMLMQTPTESTATTA